MYDHPYYDYDDCDPGPDYDEDYCGNRMMFADPGGNSALRAAGPNNPRNLPCPTCGGKNRLTPADVRLGYQCDECANAAEMGMDPPDYRDYSED